MIEEEKEGLTKSTPKKMRVNLNFKPNKAYAPEENDLLQSMARHIEKIAWKWDIAGPDYSFTLPKTIYLEPSQLEFVQHQNEDVNYMNEDDRNRRSLTKDNLDMIWRTGSFQIQSQIENLPYVWQVSKWVVKGFTNIKGSLWDDFSTSYYFAYTIKHRMTGPYYQHFAFSFQSSFYSIYQFIWETSNLFIGLPSFMSNTYEITDKINKKNLIDFLEANYALGMKLFINTIVNQLCGFDAQFEVLWKKEALIKEKEYAQQRLSSSEKAMRLHEDKCRAFDAFLNANEEFNQLNSVYDSFSYVLAKRVIIDIKLKKKEEIDLLTKEHEDLLKKSYIKYRVTKWREEQMSQFSIETKQELKEKYQNDIQNGVFKYEMPSLLYKNYRENKRDFAVKFIEEEKVTPKKPSNTITIGRKCLRPYEKYYDKGYNDEDILRLRKWRYYEVSSSFAFWRVWVFLVKLCMYTVNTGLSLLRWGFNSSVGFNALFCYHLYQDEELNINGEVVGVNESWTYPRSLSNLMIWISDSRKRFEELPDTGIFGKSIGRIFNVLYNYVIKLVIIGLILLITYPILIIVNTVISLVLFLASPLIALIGVIAEYLWNLLVNDSKYNGALLFPLIVYVGWYLLIKGVIQFVMVLICVIFQPLLAFFMILFGLCRFTLRMLYDNIMFAIVKCIGKVPLTDSEFAWKISGPGVANDYFAQITNEELIKFVRSTLEKKQLDRYSKEMYSELEQPLTAASSLSQFFSQVKVSYSSDSTLHESINHFKSILNKELFARRKLYPTLGQYRVKYSQAQLELVKELTRKYLIESFKVEDYSFLWDHFTIYEESWELLTEKILQETFGNQILETLEDKDRVIRIESKPSSSIDLIAKKVFEDPLYSKAVLVEEVKLEKEIRVPAFASFRNCLMGGRNPFVLPLHLLTKKDKEKYYGKDFEMH